MIYFDGAATTKPSAEALKKADIFNKEKYFNPSALYREGLDNNKEIKKAKESILKNLRCMPEKYEVIFTSCGSESDNQAIFCAVKKGSYVTSSGEHSAVYKSFKELSNRKNKVWFAPLKSNGEVDVDALCDYVEKNDVDFVSVMHVNNETGAVNDVNYIAERLKGIKPNILFHSDGVQAYGKIPFAMSGAIDLYSVSAHKINALKGVGALIKKRNISLSPLIFGGGQEGGLRSGTENIFGIKVFEYAGEEHYKNIVKNYEYVKTIKDYIIENLDKNLFKIISAKDGSPYILSVSAVGLRGEVLMHSLEKFGIIVGNGSACSSKNWYSRVIEACGYDNKVLDGVVRLSFTAENTMEEAVYATKILNEEAKKLKGIIG